MIKCTERKKINLTVKAWEDAFDSMADYISVHDADMQILRVNRSLAGALGKRAEQLIGKYCYKAFYNKPRTWCVHAQSIQACESVSREVNDSCLGRPLLATCSPYYTRDGDFVGFVHIARDISRQKRAQLKQEQLIISLTQALDCAKKLSGLIPICANCKKIRDEQGCWNHIECFIQENSDILFSHGICPECIKMLYG